MESSEVRAAGWSRPRIIVAAALWLLLLLLLGESALSARSAYSDRRDANTTTTGHWVDVEDRCGRYVTYSVAGREHRLDTATSRHSCSDVREGESVDVTYDADRPSTAFRGSADPRPFLALTVVTAASALTLAFAPLLLLRRHRGRRRRALP